MQNMSIAGLFSRLTVLTSRLMNPLTLRILPIQHLYVPSPFLLLILAIPTLGPLKAGLAGQLLRFRISTAYIKLALLAALRDLTTPGIRTLLAVYFPGAAPKTPTNLPSAQRLNFTPPHIPV